VVMITSLIFFMTPPFHSYALIPPLLSWGGYPVITPIPCTCSASLWSWFAPLYLSSVPMTGPMVYVPYATVPFPYYTLTTPGAPHEGAYLAGVQACWMYAGVTCFPLYSIGVMALAGVGLPGGK
jgi:hypothetical protein